MDQREGGWVMIAWFNLSAAVFCGLMVGISNDPTNQVISAAFCAGNVLFAGLNMINAKGAER